MRWHHMTLTGKISAALSGVAVASILAAAPPIQGSAMVDSLRMLNADKEVGVWMSSGRTYDEQRFSPLAQINDKNVAQLGLAWYQDLDTVRGNEATPIVVDGVLYNTAPWNITTALDAKTGKLLWTYDPKVDRAKSREACCDVVTRGVAVWKGKVIIATLDGRVIALDARTGVESWVFDTFAGRGNWPLVITGAPRVFDGKVVIGNGGADMGSRGFITTIDAETGKLLWRWYIVPGDPSKPYENSGLEMAAKTWTGDKYWKAGVGGGGNAWDSFAYDPVAKLIYMGTGNGGPWSQARRSPGGGDNLFVSSIVALKADTGEYVWHYQTTPGDEWDYTATQPMILADLKIDGKLRKVLMQQPKNGFFYVIDRITGRLISAKPVVRQTWTTGIDPRTGRANVDPAARYSEKPILVYPSAFGSHNWNPMSYSPMTGLVYIPLLDQPRVFSTPFKGLAGTTDPNAALRKELSEKASVDHKAWLSAWDPVTQTEKWRAMHKSNGNGGTLATAGNLVVQGTTESKLEFYTADTGRKLWEYDTQTVPIAGAVSYMIDGEQYIAINVGWGGGVAHIESAFAKGLHVSKGRLLVFKLGGKAQLPPLADAPPIEIPPKPKVGPDIITQGEHLYEKHCEMCHGTRAAGGIKDLRAMTNATRAQFQEIVRGGIRQSQGMVSFADVLTAEQADMILQYVNARATEDWGNF